MVNHPLVCWRKDVSCSVFAYGKVKNAAVRYQGCSEVCAVDAVYEAENACAV